MNQPVRYHESATLQYDTELWQQVERDADRLLNKLTPDFAENLEVTLANFLDLHQAALNARGMATMRQEVLDSATPVEARQNLETLMQESRALIPRIESILS